jgi:uncharacterized membrane protein
MSTYELVVFFHVTAAIVWLGSALLSVVLDLKAARSGDPTEMQRVGADGEWLAPRLFIPASLATLLFGALAVADGPWSFRTLWVDLGLAGFAASFASGMTVIKPTAEKLKRAAEEHGAASPEARRYARRLSLVSRLELVVVFAVVAVMVSKPYSGDTGTLVGLAVGVAVAWLLVAWLSRPKARAALEAAAADVPPATAP